MFTYYEDKYGFDYGVDEDDSAEREEALNVLNSALEDCEVLEDRVYDDEPEERERALSRLKWAMEEADAVGAEYDDLDDRIAEFIK